MRACSELLGLALAWPKTARIGSYGRPRHRQPPPQAGVESSGFRFNSLLGALGPVFGWSGPLFWGLLPLLAGSCLSKATPDAKFSAPGLIWGFLCPPKSIIFTRCLKSCPCAFIGAFFGCFRRRCSSYSLCFLDARAKARLAKIDTHSMRKPVFKGLRPRRRSRNEDNSGPKTNFKTT